jgi:hypothetical protein
MDGSQAVRRLRRPLPGQTPDCGTAGKDAHEMHNPPKQYYGHTQPHGMLTSQTRALARLAQRRPIALLWTTCTYVVDHMHLCCGPHALMLWTTCTYVVDHMHCCCGPHALLLWTTCTVVVDHMHCCCGPHAIALLWTTCTHVVDHMHLCCGPHALLLWTTCHCTVVDHMHIVVNTVVCPSTHRAE